LDWWVLHLVSSVINLIYITISQP